MVEHAQEELHSQHVAHAVIERLHRNLAFFDQRAQRQNEIVRRSEISLHIQTGFDRLSHGIFHVRRDAVFVVEIFDRRAVRNHVTSKPKFVSQSLGQPIMTAGDGNSIVIVIGTHHAEYSRFFDRGFKWRQKDILDFMQRGLRIGARLSFTRAFGDAVNREVFRGRCDPKIFLHRLGHLDAEP